MSLTLTQKETSLLKDMKEQEKLCVEKYTKHAKAAHDPQLQSLFNSIAAIEKHHLELLTQMETGQSPASGAGAEEQKGTTTFQAFYPATDTPEKQQYAYLCADLLATEKHASALYNTCVFEFGQPALRKTLNQIQTDEQHHGEQLWQYMKVNGMYA